MMNDNFFPSSSFDVNTKDSTMNDQQSVAHNIHSIASFPPKPEEKLSPPYMTLSIGDNRYFGRSNFQTPLLTTTDLGHETGDRIQPTNETKSNESRKHGIKKQKSNYRSNTNRNKITKTKEKRKRNSNKRKNIRQGRYQPEVRRQRCCQQQIRLKRKQTSGKKSITSKNKLSRKTSKRKPSTLSQRTQNQNTSQQSLVSKPIDWFSLILPNTDISVQNQFRQRLQQCSTCRTELRSSNESLLNNDKNTSLIHYHVASSNLKPNSNSSRKCLTQSKVNERKSKQQTLGRTKFNIRSPVHATLKKKKIRHNQKRLRSNCKRKFPRCKPNTLITIARPDVTNETNGRSLSSTAMPLTKHIAQLTSKNNNGHKGTNKYRGSHLKLKRSNRNTRKCN